MICIPCIYTIHYVCLINWSLLHHTALIRFAELKQFRWWLTLNFFFGLHIKAWLTWKILVQQLLYKKSFMYKINKPQLRAIYLTIILNSPRLFIRTIWDKQFVFGLPKERSNSDTKILRCSAIEIPLEIKINHASHFLQRNIKMCYQGTRNIVGIPFCSCALPKWIDLII